MNEVILRNKQKFEATLASYKISEHAKKVLRNVKYVVLIGPAAAGRNTIINFLVKNKGYIQVVSDTTRPPKLRDGLMETHGSNYYFRKEEDFLSDLERGEFLEAELIHGQQVSGTSIRELEKVAAENKIGINEVEFGGALNILGANPEAVVIAILPSTFKIWLDRFSRREEISRTEFNNRVETAKKVIKLAKNDPRIKVVINHEYHEAAEAVDEIVKGKPLSIAQLVEAAEVLSEYEQEIEKL